MIEINKDTHFIMFVPKSDAIALDNFEEADEEVKKECWAKLKIKELDKISGLSIYDMKPGYQFKYDREVTEVQQIGTGAVLVTFKTIL